MNISQRSITKCSLPPVGLYYTQAKWNDTEGSPGKTDWLGDTVLSQREVKGLIINRG